MYYQYLKLYNESNNFFKENDDSCGPCSKITYKLIQPCQTYSIHEGCYDSDSCGGTLLVTGGISGTYSPTPIPTSDPSSDPSTSPTASPTMAPITIYVNSIIDSNSNFSSCYPITTNNSCNLRSAWEVCNSIPSELCTIKKKLNYHSMKDYI